MIAAKRMVEWVLWLVAGMLIPMVLLATLLLLSGCESMPAKPEVVTKIEKVEIRVPVLVPCVAVPEIPKVPETRMDPVKQTVYQLAAAARLDMADWEQYAVKADSLLRGCAAALQQLEIPK